MKAIISHPLYTVVDGVIRAPITEPGNVDELARRLHAAGARDTILIMDTWENEAATLGDRWAKINGKGDYLPGLDLIVATGQGLDAARCPLVCLWPEDTCTAFMRWYESTGVHWYMTPGVAGLQVLRSLLRAGKFADLKAELPPATAEFYEPIWQLGKAGTEGAALFTVDARRAGLAAAGVAELPAFALEYSDQRKDFTHRAGWVQIERGPWNDELMPDPVGPRPERVAWVTTATLALLQELQADGRYQIGRIWDSYTAPSRRVLRKWSEIINHTYVTAAQAAAQGDGIGLPAPELVAVADAAKAVGRETIGMFDSKNGASTRSDWFHIINATKRCNIWRKADTVGRTEGIWPVAIDDDRIAYRRPMANVALLDRAFPQGIGLGCWSRDELD